MYRPVATTFLTDKGPARGTQWYDKQSEYAFVVKDVTNDIIHCDELEDMSINLEKFLEAVDAGRFILVGIHFTEVMCWAPNFYD